MRHRALSRRQGLLQAGNGMDRSPHPCRGFNLPPLWSLFHHFCFHPAAVLGLVFHALQQLPEDSDVRPPLQPLVPGAGSTNASQVFPEASEVNLCWPGRNAFALTSFTHAHKDEKVHFFLRLCKCPQSSAAQPTSRQGYFVTMPPRIESHTRYVSRGGHHRRGGGQ